MSAAQFGQTAKSVLAAVAPLIGTALGGPFGGLAGTVLAKYLGSSDPKAQEAALTSGDPDMLLKMKQADIEFKEHMTELGLNEDQLRYQDISSARVREEVVRDWTPRIIAYVVLTICFGGEIAFAWMLLHGHIIADPNTATIIGRILGMFDSGTLAILGYYFGSSAGSAAKNDTIAKLSTQ